MNLYQLNHLVERLRKEAIGEPHKIEEKHAFEYQDQSAKVVAVLKLVRAAHGVNAMLLLCRAGLFIDFGAIIRCVNDCTGGKIQDRAPFLHPTRACARRRDGREPRPN
jgi:hypothetical protein